MLAARAALAQGFDDIVVLFGDTPLITAATLGRLRQALADGAAVVVLGFHPHDPTGYGRLITSGTELLAVREDKDASEAERAHHLLQCRRDGARRPARAGDPRPDRQCQCQGEFYLTDAVADRAEMGLRAVAIDTEEDEVRGINTKAQLAEAEAALQQRLRTAALEAGVTMIAPETVFLSADTKLGADVVIEPYVVFGPGVIVEDGAVIRSFSRLEGAHVGAEATVGPFARLRPGAGSAPASISAISSRSRRR